MQDNNPSGYNQGIPELSVSSGLGCSNRRSSAYMQPNKQNQYLQEMVAKLQFENNSLKAERTTIQ